MPQFIRFVPWAAASVAAAAAHRRQQNSSTLAAAAAGRICRLCHWHGPTTRPQHWRVGSMCVSVCVSEQPSLGVPCKCFVSGV